MSSFRSISASLSFSPASSRVPGMSGKRCTREGRHADRYQGTYDQDMKLGEQYTGVP